MLTNRIISADRKEVATVRRPKKQNVATIKVGRDAKTGRFIPVKTAQKRKATAIVQTIKRPAK